MGQVDEIVVVLMVRVGDLWFVSVLAERALMGCAIHYIFNVALLLKLLVFLYVLVMCGNLVVWD